MDQSKLQNYIKYFLKGKLSLQYEKELLLWIRQSEENRKQFLQEQQRLSREITGKDDKTINIRWRKLKQKIEQEEVSDRRQFIYRIASVAAAFIAGIILTTLVIKNDIVFESQTAQIQKISVPNGARTNIQLPDGSDVWLNSGSTLSFPDDFDKSRPVTLIGEAYFDVKKNKKPFVVTTLYGEVEVRGTSFNVKAFEKENLQTTLVKGAVLVREKGSEKEVTLKPGQHATWINHEFTVVNVNTELYTSWKDGKIIFDKEYLPQVAKRLERWYNVKIVLDNDPRLSEIWYSGTLEMESFSEVLELLKVTAPIDYTYDQKTRVITIKYNKN